MPLSSTVANGDDATATQYNNLRLDALNLRAQSSTDLTIASGAITVSPTYGYYKVCAESGTADDLVTVNASTDTATGDMVMLIADTGDVIQFTTGGNLDRAGYMNDEHPITIRYNGSTWDVVRHSQAGWRYAWIPITAFAPADTNGCGAVQELDSVKVRAFDAATDESAIVNLRFPAGWSGILKARPPWMVNDGNSGNVIWAVTTENAAAGEVMGNSATTTLDASAAGETQYEVSVPTLSAAHTAGASGESINLVLFRDANNGSDTYASDAYALGLDLYYLMYTDGIEEV